MNTTVKSTFNKLRSILPYDIPDDEVQRKAALADEIILLKEKRNAVILGHNYMEPALYHSVPDFVGDSLELSRRAAATDKDPIVFCGVRFMAETAKILNPTRTVLLPTSRGGCSLAESISADDVRRLRTLFPGVPVVSYVNTYADVKAESDICCTSGNAAAVVESLHSDTVIFLPDEYLARNVANETKRHIIFPQKNPLRFNPHDSELQQTLVGWDGRCEVHEQFTVDDITHARRLYPDVRILAHPECPPDVVKASDFSASTSAMIKYIKDSASGRFLLLTECSMGDNIIAENPHVEILRLCSLRCPHMKEITLEETLDSLRLNRYIIDVPEEIRVRARQAVERMIAIG
jgi:quinolinate synthase